MNYNKAGFIHFAMDREIRNTKDRMTKITNIKNYLAAKYDVKEGLAFTNVTRWEQKDKHLFITMWVLSGYSEKTIRRIYNIKEEYNNV